MKREEEDKYTLNSNTEKVARSEEKPGRQKSTNSTKSMAMSHCTQLFPLAVLLYPTPRPASLSVGPGTLLS